VNLQQVPTLFLYPTRKSSKCPTTKYNSCPDQFKEILFNKPFDPDNPKPTEYNTPDCQNGAPKLYCPRQELLHNDDSVYVTYVRANEFLAKNNWFIIPKGAQHILKRVPVPPPIFLVRAIGKEKDKIYRGSLKLICEREWQPLKKPNNWVPKL
jgi:hypothetical protein